MNKFLMIILLVLGLVSCGSDNNTTATESSGKDRVEVIYFHGKQRCATCKAIEENTKDVVESEFAKELEDGTLVLRIVDMTTRDGENLADRYEVTWSSLFVNKWKDGKEIRDNLTEFGFGNANKNPEVFKKGLAEKIRQSLK